MFSGGSARNSGLCESSRNTKCSLETQWRWRDLSRFTNLIVRPERRSSPRRQLSPTSEAKPGFKSPTSRIKTRGEKGASTPANGVATSGMKKHTSTISWLCAAGEEEGGSRYSSGAGLSTPITLPHRFLQAQEGGGETTRTTTNTGTRTSPLTLRPSLPPSLCRLKRRVSVGRCSVLIHWSSAPLPSPPRFKVGYYPRRRSGAPRKKRIAAVADCYSQWLVFIYLRN